MPSRPRIPNSVKRTTQFLWNWVVWPILYPTVVSTVVLYALIVLTTPTPVFIVLAALITWIAFLLIASLLIARRTVALAAPKIAETDTDTTVADTREQVVAPLLKQRAEGRRHRKAGTALLLDQETPQWVRTVDAWEKRTQAELSDDETAYFSAPGYPEFVVESVYPDFKFHDTKQSNQMKYLHELLRRLDEIIVERYERSRRGVP